MYAMLLRLKRYKSYGVLCAVQSNVDQSLDTAKEMNFRIAAVSFTTGNSLQSSQQRPSQRQEGTAMPLLGRQDRRGGSLVNLVVTTTATHWNQRVLTYAQIMNPNTTKTKAPWFQFDDRSTVAVVLRHEHIYG